MSEQVVEVGLEGCAVTVTLSESSVGAGDWRATGVAIATPDASSLTAARLRALRWADVLRQARQQAAAESRSSPFAPVRPPAAFLTDRRGHQGRTDKDYAGLAATYLHDAEALGGHRVAALWAERFGGSARTWQNRISLARRFIAGDGQQLTEVGVLLVYGSQPQWELDESKIVDWLDRYKPDRTAAQRSKVDAEDAHRAHKQGKSVAEYRRDGREAADRFFAEVYSDDDPKALGERPD